VGCILLPHAVNIPNSDIFIFQGTTKASFPECTIVTWCPYWDCIHTTTILNLQITVWPTCGPWMDVTQGCQATECLTATLTYCFCVHYRHMLLHTPLFQTACGESLCSTCILPIHFTDGESTGAMPSPVMLCYKHCYEPTLPFLLHFFSQCCLTSFCCLHTGISSAAQPPAVHRPAVCICCDALCTEKLFIGWLILDYFMMLYELQWIILF
jgi:hypothetical protein